MANKMDAGRETGDETRGPLKVSWLSEPLDVTVLRNGAKVPRRKVKVRDIVRDDWLEQEAGLPAGGIRRLAAAIRKLARHGYETRRREEFQISDFKFQSL